MSKVTPPWCGSHTSQAEAEARGSKSKASHAEALGSRSKGNQVTDTHGQQADCTALCFFLCSMSMTKKISLLRLCLKERHHNQPEG
eukprot:498599-Pelagomonas_calceolata.AAC.1